MRTNSVWMQEQIVRTSTAYFKACIPNAVLKVPEVSAVESFPSEIFNLHPTAADPKNAFGGDISLVGEGAIRVRLYGKMDSDAGRIEKLASPILKSLSDAIARECA